MFVQPYLANVTIFAGVFAPRGWAFCSGQLLAISSNDALFALIGTTYGGDGVTTFALPDLRGRMAIHTGQATGLSPYILGQRAGTEQVTVLSNQLPAHTHTLVSVAGNPGANSSNGTVADPTNAVPAQLAGVNEYSASASGISMGNSPCTTNTIPVGGSQPTPIMQPFLAMNYIICTEGIFPSRN